jgi:hypothetical protein
VFVPGFQPSTSGLHFSNTWPSVPNWTIPLPGGGSIPIGNASNGLCGGMTFTVRDLHQARQQPPPDQSAPASGPLFSYVTHRLIDSWNLPLGVMRYLELMSPLFPDQQTVITQGRAGTMINKEWPAIKGDLDAHTLSPVSLVKVKSHNPMDLGKNHQVLAYGYDLADTALTIHLYDPNHADDDTVTMSLDIAHPGKATPVTYSDGSQIFCFFRSDYSFRSPATLATLGPFPQCARAEDY